ncbi:hypothetical protein GGG16DRAFT_40711, partial [Schizophyllum commune]
IDAFEDMSDTEKAELRATCRPVKFMLVKLRKLAYKVINSTTKLLPAWLQCLKDHNMPESNIPRDVSTRWNSTYDVLEYVEKHRKPLKAYLADDNHTFELEAFALTAQEWRCVKDLRNVLKVSSTDVPLVLHPRHKLQYFWNHGWKEEWIEAAKRITRDIYEERYA